MSGPTIHLPTTHLKTIDLTTIVPITLIGGYLGAGKTTLINRLLPVLDPDGLAIMVNDFGTINVDAALLNISADGRVVTFANGCICCSIQDDFAGALETLRNQDAPLKHVLVEASGVATPANLRRQSELPGFSPRGCLVVVDAQNYARKRDDKYIGRLLAQQIHEADWLHVNRAQPDTDFEASQPVLNEAELLSFDWTASEQPIHDTTTEAATFATVTAHQIAPVSRLQLSKFLSALPTYVERAKGFVAVGDEHLLVQQAANRFELSPVQDKPQEALVFITLSKDADLLRGHLDNWPGWQVDR